MENKLIQGKTQSEIVDYREEEFRRLIKEIQKKRTLTDSQIDMIRFFSENPDFFYTDYDSSVRFEFNSEQVFTDTEVYDLFADKIALEKRKIALKKKQIKITENKLTKALDRLKQERNLFFP